MWLYLYLVKKQALTQLAIEQRPSTAPMFNSDVLCEGFENGRRVFTVQRRRLMYAAWRQPLNISK